MYTVLICDDEDKIRNLIAKYIKFEGNQAIEASNGMEAIEMVHDNSVDIILMDIMMPELDGFSTVREIRKFSNTPVVMLSARGEEYDRIHGFEVGVDDYVIKPFSPKELMMRIDAIMKRVGNTSDLQHKTYTKDSFMIDFSARKVSIDGDDVNMSPKEYDLLFYLAENKGIAISREQILSKVWGYDFFGDDRTLDTHIKLLRRHLGDYSGLIVTLRGTGYRFDD